MKKVYVLLLIILCSINLIYGQSFTEIDAGITSVYNGSSAWGDYDNDGDLDLVMTGYSSTGFITKIYRNDNNNIFIDINAGLPGLLSSSVAWGDYDNDNDLDLLLTGSNGTSALTKIYKNSGNGVFSDINAGLIAISSGMAAWGDYDSDGDLDILVSGLSEGTGVTKIYRNDNLVKFTNIDAQIVNVKNSSVLWMDYNNDGKLDIIITGNISGLPITRIYKNDNGIFIDTYADIQNFDSSSLSSGDYDNDGDMDLLISGETGAAVETKIYRNDDGSFVDINADLLGLSNGCVSWVDFDNDGDLDIIITGWDGNAIRITKTYINEYNNFIETETILQDVYSSSLSCGDYDNDNDVDLFISGYSNSARVSKLYRNDTTILNDLPSTPLELEVIISEPSVTLRWGKSSDDNTPQEGLSYNISVGTSLNSGNVLNPMSNLSDGKRKITNFGNSNGNGFLEINNLKNGTYYWCVQAIDHCFVGSEFSEIDSFIVSLNPPQTPVSLPATNITAYSFNANWETSIGASGYFIDVSRNSDFTDFVAGYQNLDINNLSSINITNLESWTEYYYRIRAYNIEEVSDYSNVIQVKTLRDHFTEIVAGLPGVSHGSSAWGDYDNDSDLDILITGRDASRDCISKIYRNDNGSFTDINAGFTRVRAGSVAWGDYDNDGDLDILLTGSDVLNNNISKIYRNDNGTFTDINAGLTGVNLSSVAWGDYDNDGDLDILLTGQTASSNSISKIYCNNGNDTFTDINTGLIGVESGSVAWGDYDNDGDLDILLTGSWNSRIYRNDSGIFYDINAGLIGVNYCSVAWGDYDNDGYLDILLTGRDLSNNLISKIYRNYNGNFTDINAGLTGVWNSSVAWGDYDNDGYLDILLSGNSNNSYYYYDPVSKIYHNNGNGTFTYINAGLTGVYYSSVVCGDYDNDGVLDILLTGQDATSNLISKIYRNNSSITNTAPQASVGLSATVIGSSVQLNWNKATDNETPQDGLSYNLYIGNQSMNCGVNSPMSDLNTGFRKIVDSGNAGQNVVWKTESLAEGTYFWSVQAIDHAFAGSDFAPEQTFIFKYPPAVPVALSANSISKFSFTANWEKVEDAEGYFIDVSKDVSFTSYVSGYNNLDVGDTLSCVVANLSAFTDYFYRVRAYKIKNNPSLNSNVISLKTLWDKFSDIAIGLPDVYCSSAAWGDYDNDGDLDFFLSGLIGDYDVISKIYRNDSGSFIDTGTELPGVAFSSVAWGDYDNDGDLDFLLTGKTVSNAITRVYRNDSGSFIDTRTELPGVAFGSVAWGDYDNDGDLDIFLTGEELSGRISRIYRNDTGIFTDIGAGLSGVCYSSVAWGDYDNDGDLDILMSGDTGSGFVSRVYRNDASIFTDIGAGLPGMNFGLVAWGDYDSDGDLDILLTGVAESEVFSRIYRNDSGAFNDIKAGLPGVYFSSAAWGDYDNDGDLDILLSGCYGTISITIVYRNDSGIFNSAIGLSGVDMCTVDWGDYDNDKDLDILISGRDFYCNGVSKIYRNNSFVSDSIPNSPSNLSTSFNDSTITFSWDKATDNETPQDGLSYNFYLGTEPLTGNLNTAMSDPETGFRKVVDLGNAQQNTSYTLNKALPIGLYYWSVQAIDHAFAGSEFAPEKSFAILSSPQNVQIKHKDDLLKLTWDEVPGAQMYYVYASDDPESEFINVSKQGIFNGTTWTQAISSVKKFYYVVAVIK